MTGVIDRLGRPDILNDTTPPLREYSCRRDGIINCVEGNNGGAKDSLLAGREKLIDNQIQEKLKSLDEKFGEGSSKVGQLLVENFKGQKDLLLKNIDGFFLFLKEKGLFEELIQFVDIAPDQVQNRVLNRFDEYLSKTTAETQKVVKTVEDKREVEEKDQKKESFDMNEMNKLAAQSKEIREKVLGKVSEADFEKAKAENEAALADRKGELEAKGFSPQQISDLAYSMTVKSLLPANVPAEHQGLVKDFMGSYDKVASWLGMLPTSSNKISQRADDLVYTNDSVNARINENRGKMEFSKEWDEPLQKFAIQIYNQQNPDAQISDNSQLTPEQQEKLTQTISQLKDNIDGLSSTYTSRMAFTYDLKGYESLTRESGISAQFKKPEDSANLSLQGDSMGAKLDYQGTSLQLTREGNNLYVSDLLNGTNGVFEPGKRLINKGFEVYGISDYEKAAKNIDMRQIVSSSGSIEEVTQRYQSALTDEFDKLLGSQRIKHTSAELKSEMQRAANIDSLIGFAKGEKLESYRQGGDVKISKTDIPDNDYRTLEMLRNTTSYYSGNDVGELIESMNSIREVVRTTKDLSSHPQADILSKFDNPTTFVDFLDSFSVVDGASGKKRVDLVAIRKFADGLIKGTDDTEK